MIASGTKYLQFSGVSSLNSQAHHLSFCKERRFSIENNTDNIGVCYGGTDPTARGIRSKMSRALDPHRSRSYKFTVAPAVGIHFTSSRPILFSAKESLFPPSITSV